MTEVITWALLSLGNSHPEKLTGIWITLENKPLSPRLSPLALKLVVANITAS
jgi:hypothetical protein